jgi:D-glycero-D-manno-heptose 1,7-bisphosphate phosphatase
MKLIILDRDGVINYESLAYVKSPDEWIPIPGSLEAIAKLTQAGYTIALATNQSGVGRGLFTEATLAAIHDKMQQEVAKLGGHIDYIFYCPHTPEANCDCRKPKSGLFKQIAAALKTSLADVPAIGDTLRDIQAAQAMDCKAILVETGNGKKTLAENPSLTVPVFADLAAATTMLLQEKDL